MVSDLTPGTQTGHITQNQKTPPPWPVSLWGLRLGARPEHQRTDHPNPCRLVDLHPDESHDSQAALSKRELHLDVAGIYPAHIELA